MECVFLRGGAGIHYHGKTLAKSFLSGAKQLGFTTTGNLFQL